MATTRVARGEIVPDSAVRSEAAALANTIRALAGNERELHELATGTNPTPKESPASRKNPQNKLGHDHSGPPWGSSFLHPIAWHFGRTATANVFGERQLRPGVETDTQKLAPWTFWVPPFDDLAAPLVAPRGRLHLLLLAKSSSGTPDLTVTIASHESRVQDPTTQTGVITLSTTETEFSSDDLFINCVPGHNRADITFTAEAGGDVAIVVAMALCVRVKRYHNT